MPRSWLRAARRSVFLLGWPVASVAPQGGITLRGIVRDHLLRPGALPGAQVVLGNGSVATTDSLGRFVMHGLAPGRYRAEVSHPGYDSLEVSLSTFDIELPVADDRHLVLDLPDGTTLGRALCGAPLADDAGLVFGSVTGAKDPTPVRGIVASIAWTDLALRPTGVARQPMQVRDTSDADGRFIICHAPLDVESVVTFTAPDGTQREITAVGAGRLRLANVRWPTSGTTARVRVRVTDAAGAVGNALVRWAPAGLESRSDAEGWATVPSLALGSWAVSVRALGRTPIRRDVIIVGDTTMTVMLSRIGTLASVRVSARGDDSLGRAIAERQRRYGSLVFGDDRSTGASASHGFWTKIPGMTVRFDRSGAPVPTLGRGCRPTLFVDDQRFERWPPWLLQEMLRTAMRLEVYTLPERVPPAYRSLGSDTCGAIVVWTW